MSDSVKGNLVLEVVKETTTTVSQTTGWKFTVASQDLVTFVAKPHFVKTRKGKDYTVVRLTIPKEAVVAMGLKQEDFVFLKGRIAEWFEMLNWGKMQATWERLPTDIQGRILSSGLGPRGTVPVRAIGSATGGSGEGEFTELPAGTISSTSEFRGR